MNTNTHNFKLELSKTFKEFAGSSCYLYKNQWIQQMDTESD